MDLPPSEHLPRVEDAFTNFLYKISPFQQDPWANIVQLGYENIGRFIDLLMGEETSHGEVIQWLQRIITEKEVVDTQLPILPHLRNRYDFPLHSSRFLNVRGVMKIRRPQWVWWSVKITRYNDGKPILGVTHRGKKISLDQSPPFTTTGLEPGYTTPRSLTADEICRLQHLLIIKHPAAELWRRAAERAAQENKDSCSIDTLMDDIACGRTLRGEKIIVEPG